MEFKVYLAGPIRGLTFVGSTSWRNYVKNLFRPEIIAYSPLRGKDEVLANLPIIDDRTNPVNHPLTLRKGVVTRDRYDVLSSDLIFVNLLGAHEKSIGTMFELAWAHDHGKPIVLAMEDKGNPHDHTFVREVAGFVLPTLEEAVVITHHILFP